jgi:hypothetical protein
MNLIAPLVSTRMMTLLEVSTSSLYFSSLSLRADSALNRPMNPPMALAMVISMKATLQLQSLSSLWSSKPMKPQNRSVVNMGTIMNDLTPIVSSGPLAGGGRSRVLPRMGIPPERIWNHWGMELYAS